MYLAPVTNNGGVMKFTCIKSIHLAFLLLASINAFGETSLPQCSSQSKDPKCWESSDTDSFPHSHTCRSKSRCTEIRSIHQDDRGEFHCSDGNGMTFSCHKLVRDLGVNLQGLIVKVTTPYVDGCHVLGGCGGRACTPSYGVATYDFKCQQATGQ